MQSRRPRSSSINTRTSTAPDCIPPVTCAAWGEGSASRRPDDARATLAGVEPVQELFRSRSKPNVSCGRWRATRLRGTLRICWQTPLTVSTSTSVHLSGRRPDARPRSVVLGSSIAGDRGRAVGSPGALRQIRLGGVGEMRERARRASCSRTPDPSPSRVSSPRVDPSGRAVSSAWFSNSCAVRAGVPSCL